MNQFKQQQSEAAEPRYAMCHSSEAILGFRLRQTVGTLRNPLTMLLCLVALLAPNGQLAHTQPPDLKKLLDHPSYVPAEELDVVVARDKTGVMLSKTEFDKLLAAARANVEKAPNQPAPIVMSGADYQARIDGDFLVIDATVTWRQFADGWTQLPLPFANLSVLDATVDGQPARITRRLIPDVAPQPAANGKPQQKQSAPTPSAATAKSRSELVVFSNQVGPSSLKLKLATPLDSVGSDKSARFSLTDAPSSVLSVDVAAGRHLRVHGRQFDRPAANDQATTYRIPLGGQPNVLLLFTGDRSQQTTDSLTFASTGYGVQVAPGQVTWNALTEMQVYGTPLTKVVCTVPRHLEITDIESTGLEAWELADDPADAALTVITLNFRQPIDADRRITFKGVMAAPVAQPWLVPQLQIRQVTSHIGRAIVKHGAGVRVRVLEANGVRSAQSADREAGTLTYDLWRESFRLSFETQTHQREVLTQMKSTLGLTQAGVKLNGTLTFATLFAPLFEVDFRLPQEWTLESLQVADQSSDWQTTVLDDGNREYRVTLKTPLKPGAGLGLSFVASREVEGWPVEDVPAEVALPSVSVPQAAAVEGLFVIAADADLDVLLADLVGLDPTSATSASDRLAFAFEDTSFSGKLTIRRKPTRVAAQTLSFVRLDREILAARLEAGVEISGGGLRELDVSLPESAGSDLRFSVHDTSARIIEQVAGNPADKVRPWKLRFDQRVYGALRLVVDVAQKRQDEKEYLVPVLSIPQADRVSGYVAVEGAADHQLAITAIDSQKRPLSELDPIDLPASEYLPRQRIVGAFRYTAPGFAVTLAEERFDRNAVPTAMCYERNLVSVLSRTGEVQHQVTFKLVAVGAQSLRLTFPQARGIDADATKPPELWAVTIDGQPVEVRVNRTDAGATYLLPVPAADSADRQRDVTLFFRSFVPALTNSERLQQLPPELTVIQSDGTEQPLTMLTQNWRLHYPAQTMLTDSDGVFEPNETLDTASFLCALKQSFQSVDLDTLSTNALVAVVPIVGIFLLAMLCRRMGVSKSGCAKFAVTACVGLCLAAACSLLMFGGRAERRFEAVKSALVDDDLSVASAPRSESMGVTEDGDGIPVPQSAPTMEFDSSFDASELVQRNLMKLAEPPPESPRTVGTGRGTRTGTLVGGRGTGGRPRPERDEKDAAPKPEVKAGEKQVAQQVQEELTKNEAEAVAELAARVRVAAVEVDGPVADDNLARRPIQIGKGGLLSLSLELPVPVGSLSKSFTYTGNQPVSAGVGVDVEWEDSAGGNAQRFVLVTLIAAAAWLTIGRSRRRRGAIATLGITLPLGFVSVAPASWHVLLDGVFLGSTLAIALWVARGAVNALRATIDWISFSDVRRAARSKVAALVLLALVCLPSAANAQAPTAPATPAPATPGTPSAAVVPPVAPGSRGIVIPYADSKDPLKAERVMLSRELFVELWTKAHPELQIKTAPVGAFVAAAHYDCEVRPTAPNESKVGNNSTASIVATLILQSFRDEQTVVRLPLGAIGMSGARLNGQPAVIEVQKDDKGQNWLNVVLDKSGTHRLELDFAVPAQQDASTGQFTLPQFPAPAGEIVFKLPAPNLMARVNGATSAYRRIEKDGAAFVVIPVADSQPVLIAWRPPQEQAAVGSIVNVDSQTTVLIDDSGLAHTARLQIAVPQGALTDISFDVLKTLQVRRIVGPNLAGWELKEDAAAGGTNRKLRVFFNPPIKGSTSLEVGLFQEVHVGDEPVPVSLTSIRPLEITRETSLLGLHAGDEFSFRSPQVTGGRQIDVGQMPSRSNLPMRLAFASSARPFELTVQIARQTVEAVTKTQHAVRVGRRRTQIASRFDLDFRRVARPSLTLKLPEVYRVNEVNATSIADWYITPTDGTNPRTLTIEFKQPISGWVQVVLQGHALKGPQDLIVEAQFPQPLELSKQSTSVGVWMDAGYNATPAIVDGWKSIGSNQLPEELQRKQATAAPFAFTSEALDVPLLGFDIQIAQPRLSADAVAITAVTDTSLDYSLALKWRITGAATDTFSFTTPSSFKDRISVKGAGIRETTSTVVGDKVRWTITLQDAVSDEYFALATATLPLPTKRWEAPDIRFETQTLDEQGSPGNFVELDPQRLFAMLVNLSENQIRSLHHESVETVNAEDLPIVVSRDFLNQAAEVLRVRDRSKMPTWESRRMEQQAGAPASVNIADLSIAIAADSTWRGQAIYTLRNRRRQFLAVHLPNETQLLSVFVGGQPSRTVATKIGEKPIHLIPLPKSNESDLSFEVKLVYRGDFKQTLPRGLFPMTSDLELPAPDVIGQQESPTLGIPVARTLWHVYLPKGIDAAMIEDSARSNVSPIVSAEAEAILARNMLQDAEQMLHVLSESDNPSASNPVAGKSYRQLGQALTNYKRLNDKVLRYNAANSFYETDGITADNTAQREYAEENSRLQKKLNQNQLQIEKLQIQVGQQADAAQSVATQSDGSRFYLDNNDLNLVFTNGGASLKQFGLNLSEDTNRNGRLDLGEDSNGNGVLDINVAPTQAPLGERKSSEVRFELELQEAPAQPGKTDGKKEMTKGDGAQQQVDTNGDGQRKAARSQLRALNADLDNRQNFIQQGQNLYGNNPAVQQPAPSFNGPNPVVPNAPMNAFAPGQPTNRPTPTGNSRVANPSDPQSAEGGDQLQQAANPGLGFGGALFGGGGGGMGGGGMGGGINAGEPDEPTSAPAWTQVGGLSLPISIPLTANKMSFSKVGGSPRLALQVRSQKVLETSFGLLWTLVWTGVGITCAVIFLRARPGASLSKPLSWVLVCVGLTTFFMLPTIGQILGFVTLLIGLIQIAARYVRSAKA